MGVYFKDKIDSRPIKGIGSLALIICCSMMFIAGVGIGFAFKKTFEWTANQSSYKFIEYKKNYYDRRYEFGQVPDELVPVIGIYNKGYKVNYLFFEKGVWRQCIDAEPVDPPVC